MKHLILPALTIALLTVGSSQALAKDNDKRNIFERIGDKIADIFTGEDDDFDGEKGNENALRQIDKNLDKHGGEHHGLENARRNVSKNKGDDDDSDGLIEEIVEDIEEASDDIFDGDGRKVGNNKDFKDNPGHGNGRGHN